MRATAQRVDEWPTLAATATRPQVKAAIAGGADDLGVEVRSLLEAPDLSALIAPGDGDEIDASTEGHDDARETPTVVRAPLSSLYL